MRTPRLRKLVADATALRRECAPERTLFYLEGKAILHLAGHCGIIEKKSREGSAEYLGKARRVYTEA